MNTLLIESIVKGRNPALLLLTGLPLRRQLVITDKLMGRDDIVQRLGYCVQVRIKRGVGGTDVFLIRSADGKLTAHENQFLWALTPEQEADVMPLFEHLLKIEFSDETYVVGGVAATGYLVAAAAHCGCAEPLIVALAVRDV